jgi:4,5-DOPA dioxygenase extradiol
MYTLGNNEFTRSWKQLGTELPKPDAILCISAHWQTRGTQVTVMKQPRTIHDFSGFPEELYKIEYAVQGHPGLAAGIRQSVRITDVGPDDSWGLDHGAWTVLRHIFPGADIPVIELSLDYYKKPQYHYDLARELSFLREQGVLIIGSGNMVHNLGRIAWDHTDEEDFGYDWAKISNELFSKLILEGNHTDLINYQSLGREVQLAVPTPDHFLPLLYILAMQDAAENVSIFNDKAVMGSLTMTSVRIG